MNSGEKIKLQKLVDLIFLMLNWQVIVKKKVKLFWKTHLEVILGIAKAVAAVHKIGGINRDKRKYTNSIWSVLKKFTVEIDHKWPFRWAHEQLLSRTAIFKLIKILIYLALANYAASASW